MKRLLIAVLALALVGCAKKAGKNDDATKVVASVDGATLTVAGLNAQIPEGYVLSPQEKLALVDKWINSQLLYRAAEKEGVTREPDLKARTDQLVKEFIVNEFVQRSARKTQVTRQEVFDYLNHHKADFLYQVKIRQIILPDSATAAAVLDSLKRGGNFAALAREHSVDRSTGAGAESNYFARGVGDPVLEETIFALKPGELSGIISAADGFHIIQVVDRKQVKQDVKLEDVSDYIYSVLLYKKSKATLENMIAELKKQTKIAIHPEVLGPL